MSILDSEPKKRMLIAQATGGGRESDFVPAKPGFVPIARVSPRSAQPTHASASQHCDLPGSYLQISQPPILAFDDNPVVGENGAATLVGVSAETLKKWRQRDMGPDYIQYGSGGPVRYEVNALKAFRAAHTIRPGRKKRLPSGNYQPVIR